MDYASLTSAIEDYTDNTETTFVANIPLFIRIAEERILKNIQLDFTARRRRRRFITLAIDRRVTY